MMAHNYTMADTPTFPTITNRPYRIEHHHALTIAEIFGAATPEGALRIRQDRDGSYIFSVETEGDREEHQMSVRLLAELIGHQRFQRICHEEPLDLTADSPLRLTKKTISQIFMRMMDIQKEEIDGLEGPLSDRYQKLLLFPTFGEFQRFFGDHAPPLEQFTVDKATSSGQGFIGLAERVTLAVHHHFSLIEEKDRLKNHYRDVELITSRLADREMQKGSVIHLTDGYYYVDEIFVGGGAYISILRDLTEENPPKIVCRGTAMRKTATGGYLSGANDIQLEVGTLGIRATWPAIAQYLRDQQIMEVEILGKSLGGAHAQGLALLIEGIEGIEVKKLITCGSIGVAPNLHELFRELVIARRTTPFQIEVLRNGGDNGGDEPDDVPSIGGAHLGVGLEEDQCTVDVVYISRNPSTQHSPLDMWMVSRLARFIRSFGIPHCRQTTLQDFHWVKIEGSSAIHQHLLAGTKLEGLRQAVAYLIHGFTLSLLNGQNFASYCSTLAVEG